MKYTNKPLLTILFTCLVIFNSGAEIHLKSGMVVDSTKDVIVFGELLDSSHSIQSQVEDRFGRIELGHVNKKQEKKISIDSGLSATWYNSSQSGHGFMIEVLSNGSLLMSWYVYDKYGDPIFLIGVGTVISTSQVRFDMKYINGMPWGSFNPTNVINYDWGTINLTFNSCTSALISYDSNFTDQYGTYFGSGTIPISRLTTIQDLPCNFSSNGGNTTRLSINNKLLNDVNIFVDGQFVGISYAGETQGQSVTYSNGLNVSWELVRSVTSSNSPIGDTISGTFSTINNPGSNVSLVINNRFSDGSGIFTPVIDNKTNSNGLIGVNMGLQAENRCNCIAPAGLNVRVGYYRWFSNSNVRSYSSSSNYTGGYSYWENFSSSVQVDTGRLNLVIN